MVRPWVVAHRGASAECPENTIASFDRAIADGCDAIELDVQLSRDGIPVVLHDWTLAKAGLRGRRVERLDAAELGRLDVGSWFAPRFRDQRVPTLAEVLRRHGRRVVLMIELKVHDRDRGRGGHLALAAGVRAAVRAQRLEDDVLLLSFDPETLAAAAGASGRPRPVLNLSAPRRVTAATREQIRRWFAMSVDVRSLSASFAAATHEAGRPLLAWTCNSPRRVRQALTCGADAIMSDSPAWLASRLHHSRAKR